MDFREYLFTFGFLVGFATMFMAGLLFGFVGFIRRVIG
jgi:hypothetical protein